MIKIETNSELILSNGQEVSKGIETEITPIDHCRNVRGLGKSMVVKN